jgi:adenine-specific DNA-methyltransferase
MNDQSLPAGVADWRLLKGDCTKLISRLPDNTFSLIVTSPPYNIGKIYERGKKLSLDEYVDWIDGVIEKLIPKLTEDGSICWQTGNYIRRGELFPLDTYFYDAFKSRGLRLRNRIIWRFNFGLNSKNRFSGRYETILWFTREKYKFNLDPVRIPQLYPGKRRAGVKKGELGAPTGNPKGKNPADYWEFSATDHFNSSPVWDVPNVKANHPEKTKHPCQFPIELVERCVLALTDPGDHILDPFVGTGTTILASLKHHRKAIGIEKDGDYVKLARSRINRLYEGTLGMRTLGKPVARPNQRQRVAQIPDEWKTAGV